ncbi:MAG TPA: glycosyl transferase family 1, partial [Fibrobacteria bacterium]|nr:glycosyl transferase family 1 [Fibrobacteria bacterium]
MKIVLANKFYYPRGGDCVYTMELEKALRKAGHEVAVFAMQFAQNTPTPWSRYFPSEVAFSPKRPWSFVKAMIRPFYAPDVRQRFE